MFQNKEDRLPPAFVQAIEDAILFGNVRELDGVLEIAKDREDCSEDLRHGIEALLYFRLHYGKGGLIELEREQDRQTALHMEFDWSHVLLDMINNRSAADGNAHALAQGM